MWVVGFGASPNLIVILVSANRVSITIHQRRFLGSRMQNGSREGRVRAVGSVGPGPTSESKIDGWFPIKLMSAVPRAPRSHTISPGRPSVMNGTRLFSIVSRRYTERWAVMRHSNDKPSAFRAVPRENYTMPRDSLRKISGPGAPWTPLVFETIDSNGNLPGPGRNETSDVERWIRGVDVYSKISMILVS